MPELPEVEVTRRRLAPWVEGRVIVDVVVRAPKLRLPLDPDLPALLRGRVIRRIDRRGKYLMFDCESGWLVIHLGMTGFLRMTAAGTPAGKHDHLDIVLDDGQVLRFHDPRKFGTVLWTVDDPLTHPLLAEIGPEPLSDEFSGEYLFQASRSRSLAIKLLIMNMNVVAGVGNIYANEALFRAGVSPERPVRSLSREECERVAAEVKKVLVESVEQGSTYQIAEGSVSYHPLTFNVYGRRGGKCLRCGADLVETRLGNRSTVFCPACQR